MVRGIAVDSEETDLTQLDSLICPGVERIVAVLQRESARIERANKWSVRINFAGQSLSIRIEEFLVEQ